MSPASRKGVSVRTPSSAMLVQMLFVMSAIGTGAVTALVTWMGPKRTQPKTDAPEKTEKRDA